MKYVQLCFLLLCIFLVGCVTGEGDDDDNSVAKDVEIFVAETQLDRILVFDQNDEGDIAPKREIGGASTRLADPNDLFIVNG